jgi:hypothetical protein
MKSTEERVSPVISQRSSFANNVVTSCSAVRMMHGPLAMSGVVTAAKTAIDGIGGGGLGGWGGGAPLPPPVGG